MSDTHIHIHLSGEAAEAATSATPRPKSSPKKAKPANTSKPRKAGAYQKRYGKHFKRLAPRYKKKSGGWKKGGFKATQKAAHKAAKK